MYEIFFVFQVKYDSRYNESFAVVPTQPEEDEFTTWTFHKSEVGLSVPAFFFLYLFYHTKNVTRNAN